MKKLIAFALCFIMVFCFSACKGETRIDMTVLSERMAQFNENYAFDYFDTFVYEDSTRIFFSLCSENDIMLTLNSDEDGKIRSVNVLAVRDKMKTDGEREAYRNFSSAVIDSFVILSEKERKERDTALSYGKPNTYFSDLYETYSSQRYHFIFSSNSEFISLDCEYYETIELTDSNQ